MTIAALGTAKAGSTNAHWADPKDPERLVIGLDMSASNPLVDEADHARKIASRVADYVRALPVKSEVIIRPLGMYNSTSNELLRIDSRISSKNRPEDLAFKIEQLIGSIPDLVRSGTLNAEGYTNILAFLENMNQVVDCGDIQTTYILLSDGIEDSQYTNLRNSNSTLPRDVLRTGDAKCHELQILGIGRGMGSPQETKRIRDEWRVWAEEGDANPFLHFIGLNDW
ncbi:MAG TPA: hypothetical protein EYN91_25125 [Candidatus Melainabacteria bacterium]|nr:hypothetical protein [Candidatus Melainabacteria bacterium]